MRLAKRKFVRRISIGVLVAAALSVLGCENLVKTDPLAVITNRQRPTSERIAAVLRVPLTKADSRAEQALSYLVWTEQEPMPLREAAANRLIDHNADNFKAQLNDQLLDVQRWVMLRFLLHQIARHHWTHLTGLVIRSWARRSKIYRDAKRPERATIAALDPKRTVRQTLIAFFRGQAAHDGIADQAAAWTVLCRTMGRGERRKMLASSSTTLLVRDLQAASGVLDRLPHNREGLLWLAYVLNDHRAIWNEAAKIAGQLTADQRAGLAIRHVAMLTHLPQAIREMSRAQLLVRVGRQLAGKTHASRGQHGQTDALEHLPPQTLAAHAHAMCWADLAQVELILRAMKEPSFAPAVFAQADADLADKRSEHGGVLTWKGSRVIAKAFAPAFRAGDRRYIASEKLIQCMYTGLAHYHFHAQHYDNAIWAGPGPGDLNFADRQGTAAVVFTFINKNTINVDYYKPGWVVIDLGMLRRKPRRNEN